MPSIATLNGCNFSVDSLYPNAAHAPLSHPPESTSNLPFKGSSVQPRLVSVDSMRQANLNAPVQSPGKTTLKVESSPMNPLDVLRDLVTRRQQSSNVERDVSFTPSTMISGHTRIASVFDEPSEMLRRAVKKAHASSCMSPRVSKKRRIEQTSPLHEACLRGASLSFAELDSILRKDPGAAARPFSLKTRKRVYDYSTQKVVFKLVLEPYQYPLNIAISHKCSPAILERLVEAAPHVLELADNEQRSLHILLRHNPQDTSSMDMMLLKKHDSALWKDDKGNSVLHQAVLNGASLQTVRHLVLFAPNLLLDLNADGLTPLALAQRNVNICSEEVSSYLLAKTYHQFNL